MPRGSRPGERRGGRQRGTPNKKTVLKNAALAAAATNPDISPQDFLLGVMRDPKVSSDLRVRVALALARPTHAKPVSARRHDPIESGTLIGGTDWLIDAAVAMALRDDYERLNELIRRGEQLSTAEKEEESMLRARIADTARAIGCAEGYGSKQERNDSYRLHSLHCKRLSCGGGSLSESESTEEAQLTARVLAFQESPEGVARRRIFELKLQSFSTGLSAAEQDELDSLQNLHPDEPLDCDPLKDAIEAYGRAADMASNEGGRQRGR